MLCSMNPTVVDHRAAVQRVIDHVETHIGRKFGLDELCGIAAMSRHHFCRLFHIYTGMRPLEYVRWRKIVSAAGRIAAGEVIVDVAVDLGYGSHSAFSRAFRRATGESPTEWAGAGNRLPEATLDVRTRRFTEDDLKMAAYETEHLVLRTFRSTDWPEIQRLAIDKENSPAAHLDQAWPTSDKECEAIANHFAGNESFWAICPKGTDTIAGIIVFNGIDDKRTMDLGHLVRTEFAGTPAVTEALTRMVQYVFDELEVDRIIAHNAIAWKGQTEPLTEIGFTEVGTGKASFSKRPDGTRIEFVAMTVEMTRSRWETASPGK